MESSSSQQAVHPVCRSDIRRAILNIVRRSILQRLTQLRLDYGYNAPEVTRLSKADRCRVIQQSRLIEDILYKRADTMADYQDLSTLEERVFKAGRAVFISAQRQEMERESERRVAIASALAFAAALGRTGAGPIEPPQRRVAQLSPREGHRPRRRMSF